MNFLKTIRNYSLIAAALIGTMTASAKTAPQQVTKLIEASNFDAVRTSSQFNVNITTGADYKVEVNVPDNVVPYLDINVSNNRLVVRLKKDAPRIEGDLKCNVTMPKLSKVTASGQSSVDVFGNKLASDLVVIADGQAAVKFVNAVKINRLEATASGQSVVKMGDVSLQSITADASGQSVLKFASINTDQGSLQSSGQSTLKVGACTAKSLSAQSSGQSALVLKGVSCPNLTQSKSGQSSLKIVRK